VTGFYIKDCRIFYYYTVFYKTISAVVLPCSPLHGTFSGCR